MSLPSRCPACHRLADLGAPARARARACPHCGSALTAAAASACAQTIKARADAASTGGAWPPLRAPSVRALNPD